MFVRNSLSLETKAKYFAAVSDKNLRDGSSE